MDNKRRLVRIDVADFLEIRQMEVVPTIVKAKTHDLTPMGLCFCSEMEWQKGQILMIDYFMPQELDSVQLQIRVIWSEFIDAEQGYFCGGEIIDLEEAKETTFVNYYYRKLKERFF